MDADQIRVGDRHYAYCEYPKPYENITAQPNPIRVSIVMVRGDRVTMRRADGRSFLVGSALVEKHTVASRKIIASWSELLAARVEAAEADRLREQDAENRRRQLEEVLPYFEGIEIDGLDLETYLRREFTQETPARSNYVTLQPEVFVAIGRRIRELQALAAQNALDESNLEGWTNA